jgi:hypothetical protein
MHRVVVVWSHVDWWFWSASSVAGFLVLYLVPPVISALEVGLLRKLGDELSRTVA